MLFDKDSQANERGGAEDARSDGGRTKFVQYSVNACMCTIPRAHGTQLRHNQPAFTIAILMKLVSVEAHKALHHKHGQFQ
jgi:hypothetical protein